MAACNWEDSFNGIVRHPLLDRPAPIRVALVSVAVQEGNDSADHALMQLAADYIDRLEHRLHMRDVQAEVANILIPR